MGDTNQRGTGPIRLADLPKRLGGTVIVIGLLCLTTVLTGVIWRWQLSYDALTNARKAGVIRIGYAVEAPYAFLTSDGQVTGESPEVARAIAARLGIPRIEWRLAEFGDLIGGLEARRFDVIAAGMFITSERKKRVAFSLPTFQAGPALLVRKGNPLQLHSYSDLLYRTNARIAVLTGSAEESYLLQLGLSSARLLRVPDASSGRAAVRSGQSDALALSAPSVRWMVMHPIAGLTAMVDTSELEAGKSPLPRDYGAFVFRKEDRALCRAWNAALSGFVGSKEHRNILKAFGFTVEELPPENATDLKASTPRSL
jgi:polar amino acid transport system substrate-binding protein